MSEPLQMCFSSLLNLPLELSEDVLKRAALSMPSHSLIKLRQGFILSFLYKSKEKGRNKQGAVS